MKILLTAILVSVFSFSFGQFGGGGMGMGSGAGRRGGTGAYGGGNMQTNTTRERMTPEERALKQTEAMTKKIDLNPEQANKVSEINLRYGKQAEGFMNDLRMQNDVPEIMMKKMKDFKIRNDYDKENEMKAILDEDQFKKYQKFKSRNEGFEGNHGNYNNGGGNYGGGGGYNRSNGRY